MPLSVSAVIRVRAFVDESDAALRDAALDDDWSLRDADALLGRVVDVPAAPSEPTCDERVLRRVRGINVVVDDIKVSFGGRVHRWKVD